MERLIDADKFIEWLGVGHLRSPTEPCMSELNVKKAIELQPTVNAVPVVRGEWIKRSNEEIGTLAICSKCSYPISWWHRSKYCPSCGAKMDNERRNNDA